MSEEYKLSHLVAIGTEIKPCPLCGGKAQVNVWKYQNDIVEQRCFCLNENCSLSLRTYEVSEWNTRPIEDTLRSRVEELEAVIKAQKYVLDDKFFNNSMQTLNYQYRVEELERENNRLASKAHDLLSQLEIATDLGQKRWAALNEIVEHAGMKSSDWCRRKAKEGLGLK